MRKGRFQDGNRRPDPDIMDLHHLGTQPANIPGWKQKVFQSLACFSCGISLFSRETSKRLAMSEAVAPPGLHHVGLGTGRVEQNEPSL